MRSVLNASLGSSSSTVWSRPVSPSMSCMVGGVHLCFDNMQNGGLGSSCPSLPGHDQGNQKPDKLSHIVFACGFQTVSMVMG